MAMSETDVKLLSSRRSTLKRKLTLQRNLLRNANQLSQAELDELYAALKSLYAQFADVHLEFCEAVESDVSFSEYKTTNGLDLDQYSRAADKVYEEAINFYKQHFSKFMTESISRALDTANRILVNKSQDSRLFSNHMQTCIKLGDQYLLLYENRHDELYNAIIEMSCAESTGTSFGANSLSANNSRPSSHILTTSQISQGGASLPRAESTRVGSDAHHSDARESPTPIGLNFRNNEEGGNGGQAGMTVPTIQQETSSSNVSLGNLNNNNTVINTHVPNSRNNIVSAYANRPAPSLYNIDTTHSHSKTVWQEPEYKKMTLPKFSGNREDWAEFRAVWLRYIAHAKQTAVDEVQIVYQLKQCLSGEPKERVAAIYATQDRPLEHMFEVLESIYSDISSSVQYSLSQLSNLSPVLEGDFRGLIKLINSVERCYSQLAEVGQVSAVNMTHVDDISDQLPFSIQTIWMNQYQSFSVEDKIHPFPKFMLFLSSQRNVSQRYADRQTLKEKTFGNSSNHSGSYRQDTVKLKGSNDKSKNNVKCFQAHTNDKTSACVLHEHGNHDTAVCKAFIDMSVNAKYEALKSKRACFRCFGKHMIRSCYSKDSCLQCDSKLHHTLLCNSDRSRVKTTYVSSSDTAVGNDSAESNLASVFSNTGTTGRDNNVIFAVQQAQVKGVSGVATLFYDSGSNSSFITRKAVKRLKSRMIGPVSLDLATMGGGETEVETQIYEVELVTSALSVVVIPAYCMDYITGPVGSLDLSILSKLFPGFDVSVLQRQSEEVDILIGMDLEGLHPVNVLAESGPNLRVKSTPFGPVIMGSHSEVLVLNTPCSNSQSHNLVGSHAVMKWKNDSAVCNLSRAVSIPVESFIRGEELGTEVFPKCGACKCSKCPILGHTFSFTEEQELRMIRENLRYDGVGGRWVTKYPWVIDPYTLPNNFSAALATLKHTEKVLMKDEILGEVYGDQIQDMVDRGVARILSRGELEQWSGPIFYLSHLAVLNPKSLSTPVRIVFNSSQVYQGFSLNGSLAKGPDSYLNNLLGVLLRWRENRVAMTADIRKMYNSIHIDKVEQHCHRFLWRDLDASRMPDIYCILRVNMGDKPAGAISTEAIYLTAEMFQKDFPRVATMLKVSTYVDDIIDSVSDIESAVALATDTNEVLSEAGFKIKHWLFSGENAVRLSPEVLPDPAEEVFISKVLGVTWGPKRDVISFIPSLNFSGKKKGVYINIDLSASEVPQGIPLILTRRMVLEQTMKVYDPFGILAPFTLIAKILLRKTWSLSLGWDDPIPSNLREEWVDFFGRMFEFSSLEYDRSFMPESRVGNPILVILSDGSDLAYGFSAYVRWNLPDGRFWCRLVMSKCRIAPMRRISTPQMELNAAVLSKRARKVLESELRLSFEKVYQMVDSETVLHMINKISTRFKVYEGVRVGEIQQATNGDMSDWFWIPGTSNVSDWVTRGKMPSELGPDSEWWLGPSYLYLPESEWQMKAYRYTDTVLPGEKQLKKSSVYLVSSRDSDLRLPYSFEDFNSGRKFIHKVARIMNMCRLRSFSGFLSKHISLFALRSSLEIIVRVVQSSMESELLKKKGKYCQVAPWKNSQGIWVVGSRLARYNPMSTPLSDLPQILLPAEHRFTLLLMTDAHEECMHKGRDSTLARFRYKFWTTRGNNLARRVVSSCYECRRKEPILLSQQMGQLPIERLKPAPPFTSVMLDLFGPYTIRGEIQKRVNGRGYGVMFVDMFSRAVHIEGVFAYDTQSFLNALSRFACIRGWPETIYSDCGSQIVAASNALKSIWDDLDHAEVVKQSATQGLKWVFGPPDSPWHQGAVESLVKGAKRAIHFAVGDRRLSASEFLTICTQIANIMNERPLGTLPGPDSHVNLFTPNCLLIGRAVATQPGGLDQRISPSSRLAIIESSLDDFWKVWVQLYAPTLMSQRKWRQAAKRELCIGDIVVVADSNSVRGRYYIARVTEVFPGCDGKIRKVALEYRNCQAGTTEYRVSKPVKIIRAVQRLALLVPVDGEGYPKCHV